MMVFEFQHVVESAGKAIDLAGVGVLILGSLLASGAFLRQVRRGTPLSDAYRSLRMGIGRAILLGLELLVAADIIRTVAIAPTFTSVGVLAIIVLIRTFLSMALEVELEGRFPWQQRREEAPAAYTADVRSEPS